MITEEEISHQNNNFFDMSHPTRGCRVLVHCSAGESRSPTIVIAFLISTRGCTFLEAFSLVKERRPSINPNPSFVAQLKQIV